MFGFEGKDGCTPIGFYRQADAGILYVDEEALKTNKQLQYWVGLALEYNKVVKAVKRKKKL